jgi:hypothetical protein
MVEAIARSPAARWCAEYDPQPVQSDVVVGLSDEANVLVENNLLAGGGYAIYGGEDKANSGRPRHRDPE